MAELNPVDPSDIHAVVVGLEYYHRAPADWSLRGAGHDALRFARWLRQGGVPPQNIRLLLSPIEESRTSLETAVTDAGLEHRVVTSSGEIRDVFVHELKNATGKLLYVYWGGHGVLGKEGRLLFHPDASSEDKVCLGVDELRAYLTNMASRGFSQQVLFFDACATFVEEHGAESAPVVMSFPNLGRETVQQFLLHASRDGQAAEQNDLAASGAFSTVLLEWLEEHASDLHPDLSALHDKVELHFEERYAAGGPAQTPVTCRHLTLDGARDDMVTYASPVDHAAQLEVRGSLESSSLNEGRLMVYAARVAQACGVTRLAAGYSVEVLAKVLLDTPRAMATFIGLLLADSEIKTAGLFLSLALTHNPPGLLSVGEHVSLRELLTTAPDVSPATVNAITQHVLPGGGVRVDTTGAMGGEELLAHIENLEQHPGGFSQTDGRRRTAPAVVRFTETLAALFDQDRQWCDQLGTWGRRVAERLGVDVETLDKLRNDAVAWTHAFKGSSNTPRVVVQVYPEHATNTFTCVVWTDTGTGELVRYPHDDNGVPLTPAQAVRLIQRATRSLSASDAEAPVVEIVLDAGDMLAAPVYAWSDPEPVPMMLAVRRRMVLRCAPLASIEHEDDRRARLERRWSRHADGRAFYLDQAHTEGDSAYGILEEDQDVARVVVRTNCHDSARMIQLALYLGFPVIMWDAHAPQPVTDTHFAPLEPEGPLLELPERVRSYWAKICADSGRYPVRPALLLDDPDQQLPPVQALTPQFASDEASV